MMSRPRTSPLWQHFKRFGSHTAKCNLCKKSLSYKSSITNLKRHLLLQHSGTFETADPSEICVPNLIELVQKYPCLWDTRCDSYANTELKYKSWKKIAYKLYPCEDSSKIAVNISEQFNIMRNEFFLNRSSKHSKELSFMEPLLENHQPSVVLSTKEDPDENVILEKGTQNRVEDNNCNQAPRLDLPQSTEETCRRQTRPETREETPNWPLLDCSLQLTNADEDTLFLLSLVDEIRHVPLESAMMFKAELVTKFGQLVRTYENKNTS